MKYKPKWDIPTFAQRYNTMKPSELARVLSEKRGKCITSDSIRAWFKNNPEIHDQLTKIVARPSGKKTSRLIPNVLAELITEKYDNVEIVGLETLELARKQLDLIENDIKTQICREKQLTVLHGHIKHFGTKKKRKRRLKDTQNPLA